MRHCPQRTCNPRPSPCLRVAPLQRRFWNDDKEECNNNVGEERDDNGEEGEEGNVGGEGDNDKEEYNKDWEEDVANGEYGDNEGGEDGDNNVGKDCDNEGRGGRPRVGGGRLGWGGWQR